jgi:hypothetical protein
MAVGPPTAKVEIEWTPGTWTDVSSYLAGEEGMGGSFGRATEFDDVSAGAWNVTLRNDDGRFTPNNPLSPYYPNVVENVRLRVSMTAPGGSTYVRFLGYVTAIEPAFPDEDGSSGLVKISAADLLAVLNRRTMDSQWIEQAKFLGRLYFSWADVYDFGTPAASPTTFQNVGFVNGRTTVGTAQMVAANTAVGQWSVDNTDTGALTTPTITLAPSGIVGPVLQVVPGGTAYQVDFFVNIPSYPSLASGIATSLYPTVASFWAGSTELFSLKIARPTAGALNCDLYFVDSAGVASSLASVGGTAVDTGVWTKISVTYSGGLTYFSVNEATTGITLASNLNSCTKIFFGGRPPAGIAGKQTNCIPISIGGVALLSNNLPVSGFYEFGAPPACLEETRWRELCAYAADVLPWRDIDMTATNGSAVITSSFAVFNSDDVGRGVTTWSTSYYSTNSTAAGLAALPADTVIASVQSPTQATLSNVFTGASGTYQDTIIGPSRVGTDSRNVVRVDTKDSSAGVAMQNLARTVGGAMWVTNTGVPQLISADAMRSKTPLASVDIENDCFADDLELRRAVDQAPTRVSTTSPIGQAIVTDSVAEALGYRREVSVDTGCATYEDLQAVATYYLSASKALRISRLTVDLATSVNNLYASFLGSLRPGSRLRVTNLPSATFGFSYVDVYVQGWTETYTHEGAVFTFDCSPADAPVEAIFDDTEYGRFAADKTLNLAYAVTSSGTSLTVVPAQAALTGNPVMTTTVGDYPLDIDLNGERVTLAAAPSTGSRTNLVTNPKFTTNTTGWTGVVATFTTSTLARSNTVYGYIGSDCAVVTWPAAASGGTAMGYTATTVAATTYTFSVWVYVPSGCPGVTIAVLTGAPTGVTYGTQNSTGTNNNWVRLSVTFTASAASHVLGIKTLSASTAGQYAFVSNALLESGSNGLGSFFDGTYGGSWTGTANASTSTQATQIFAGCTRGVAPGVARAHLGGEDVEVWHAAAFAF